MYSDPTTYKFNRDYEDGYIADAVISASLRSATLYMNGVCNKIDAFGATTTDVKVIAIAEDIADIIIDFKQHKRDFLEKGIMHWKDAIPEWYRESILMLYENGLKLGNSD